MYKLLHLRTNTPRRTMPVNWTSPKGMAHQTFGCHPLGSTSRPHILVMFLWFPRASAGVKWASNGLYSGVAKVLSTSSRGGGVFVFYKRGTSQNFIYPAGNSLPPPPPPPPSSLWPTEVWPSDIHCTTQESVVSTPPSMHAFT